MKHSKDNNKNQHLVQLHDPNVLFQPLLMKILKHIFRVLSAHTGPFQGLNMIATDLIKERSKVIQENSHQLVAIEVDEYVVTEGQHPSLVMILGHNYVFF